jgi:hypothetical protein
MSPPIPPLPVTAVLAVELVLVLALAPPPPEPVVVPLPALHAWSAQAIEATPKATPNPATSILIMKRRYQRIRICVSIQSTLAPSLPI